MALSYQDILNMYQQARLGPNSQGVPDSLNPNAQVPQSALMQGVMSGVPQAPAVPEVNPSRMPASDMSASQGIPDALKPSLGAPSPIIGPQGQINNQALMGGNPQLDAMFKNIGMPGFQGPPHSMVPSTSNPLMTFNPMEDEEDKEKSSAAPKDEKEEDKEQPEQKQAKSEDKSEEDDSDEEDDDQENPNKKYSIEELQRLQTQARNKAGLAAGLMQMMGTGGAVINRHIDVSGLQHQMSNDLGRAADYKTLIDEQRQNQEMDIRQNAADVDLKKAVMQLGDAKQMHDVDSDISNSAREVFLEATKQAGMSIPPEKVANLSYSAMVQIMPQLDKIVTGKLTAEWHKEVAAQRLQGMQQQKQQMMDKYDDGMQAKLRKELEASNQSSRTAIGQNARIIDSADRVTEFLGDAMKNPDKINNIQMNELARVIDTMLSNGASTVGGMTKLTPTTAGGSIAGIEQYLTGQLTGTNQGEFVKQFMAATQREKALAQMKINAYHQKVLSGYTGLAQRRPDEVKDMMDKFEKDAMESLPSQSAAKSNAASGTAPAAQAGTVTIRRKSDGTTKTLAADAAQKYLSDPAFEEVK